MNICARMTAKCIACPSTTGTQADSLICEVRSTLSGAGQIACSPEDITEGNVAQMYFPFQSGECPAISQIVATQSNVDIIDFTCCSSNNCNTPTPFAKPSTASVGTEALPPPPTTSPPCNKAGCLLGGARPAPVVFPPSYQPDTPAPLLLFLEGYFTGSGLIYADYFHLISAASAAGAILVAPNGTIDRAGFHFWNTPDGACCNFDGSTVNDLAYLEGLITGKYASFPFDPTP